MMFLKTRHFIVSTSLLLCSSFALANAAVNSSTTLYQRPKKTASIWSGFINSSRSTGLNDFQDGTRSDSMDYAVRVNANVSDNYFLRLDGGYSQNLKDQTKSDASDTMLSLRRTPFTLGKNLILSYSLGGTAPTSKDSRDRQNMQGSARTGLIMAINPSRLIPGFGVASSISLARNFHSYETSVTGAVLNEYSSTQALTLSYDFPVGISLSLEAAHLNARSYQGTLKESYQITEDISYQFNRTFAGSIGHSNSGNALRPNGQDYSYQIYNENSSVVYASLTIIL